MAKKSRVKKDVIKFYIYSIEGCSYCIEAEKMLGKYPYEDIIVDENNRDEIFEKIDKLTNKSRSFPIIFIDDTYVGGLLDLQKLLL